ncbi:MAG: lysophospholipid acyltransferase family protein [Nocardioidaceae bacterium]
MANPRRIRERPGWAYALCIVVLEPLLRLFTRRRWIDGDKIPAEGGCVLAANHISHLDPVTFAHYAYGYGRLARFLAKAEVFTVPVIGPVVAGTGQIPVSRQSTDASHAFQAAVRAVQEGECVVVYPEGTITREPDLWPMTGKTGAARIALSAGVPVIPVAQWGAHRILAPYTKTPKLLPRKWIEMKAGDPVDLDDLRGQKLTPAVLREATNRIMDAITAQLADLRGQQPPAVRFDPRTAGVRQTGNPHAPREQQ